ncbi:hypothetical protein BJX68DRAFT_213496 [Aspergillus pseudodeflectus]|uniref:Secreted protein n=1 Tax=Aspergillus pseudodeflectus TaxID=176178 RepID=A0ABR4JFB2_9EURO
MKFILSALLLLALTHSVSSSPAEKRDGEDKPRCRVRISILSRSLSSYLSSFAIRFAHIFVSYITNHSRQTHTIPTAAQPVPTRTASVKARGRSPALIHSSVSLGVSVMRGSIGIARATASPRTSARRAMIVGLSCRMLIRRFYVHLGLEDI